jgi:hypothetical protein
LDFCRFFRHISLHLNDNLMQTTYDLVVSLKETRFGLSLYSQQLTLVNQVFVILQAQDFAI